MKHLDITKLSNQAFSNEKILRIECPNLIRCNSEETITSKGKGFSQLTRSNSEDRIFEKSLLYKSKLTDNKYLTELILYYISTNNKDKLAENIFKKNNKIIKLLKNIEELNRDISSSKEINFNLRKKNSEFQDEIMSLKITMEDFSNTNAELVKSNKILKEQVILKDTEILKLKQQVVVIDVDTLCDENKDFLCPISMEIFKNPVIAEDGFTYEERSIKQWFSKKKNDTTSPKTGQRMGKKLMKNQLLKNMIISYRDRTSSILSQEVKLQNLEEKILTCEEKFASYIDIEDLVLLSEQKKNKKDNIEKDNIARESISPNCISYFMRCIKCYV